jgi:hypothetical protein
MAKTKITIETERPIKEVRIVWTENEANDLLEGGWMLMTSGIAHRDQTGYQAKPMFILARQ